MKKTLFSAVLAAIFGLVSLQASAAQGTITFQGEVNAITCTVTAGTGASGTAANLTVTLPNASVTDLTTAGNSAMETPFSLIIGGPGQDDCIDGKVVSLKFEQAQSTQINPATGNLMNTVGAGKATNVEIGLLTGTKQVMNLNDTADLTSINSRATIAGNTATLSYYARYVATAQATSGDVNTNVVYSLQYN